MKKLLIGLVSELEHSGLPTKTVKIIVRLQLVHIQLLLLFPFIIVAGHYSDPAIYLYLLLFIMFDRLNSSILSRLKINRTDEIKTDGTSKVANRTFQFIMIYMGVTTLILIQTGFL